MAAPKIKRQKSKTVPLGKPFEWNKLSEEEQINFGVPGAAFVLMVQSGIKDQPRKDLLDAGLVEILEE